MPAAAVGTDYKGSVPVTDTCPVASFNCVFPGASMVLTAVVASLQYKAATDFHLCKFPGYEIGEAALVRVAIPGARRPHRDGHDSTTADPGTNFQRRPCISIP